MARSRAVFGADVTSHAVDCSDGVDSSSVEGYCPPFPERKVTVRKIINSTYVTLDGVIQNPQDWPSTGGFGEKGNDIQLKLLENSDAVLISPRSALAAECAAGKLIELRLSEQRYPGSTGIWLVTLANRTPSPAAAMIIQQVETLLRDLMLGNGPRRRATSSVRP